MLQPNATLISKDIPPLNLLAREEVAVELVGTAASSGITVDWLMTSTILEGIRIDVYNVEDTPDGERTRRPSELSWISLTEPQHVVLSALQQNPPSSHCVTCRALLLGLPEE